MHFICHKLNLLKDNDHEEFSHYIMEEGAFSLKPNTMTSYPRRALEKGEFSTTDCRRLEKSSNGLRFDVFKVQNFQKTCLYCIGITPVRSWYGDAYIYPTPRENIYRRNIQEILQNLRSFIHEYSLYFFQSHLLCLFLSFLPFYASIQLFIVYLLSVRCLPVRSPSIHLRPRPSIHLYLSLFHPVSSDSW